MDFIFGLIVGAVAGAVLYGSYVKSFVINVNKEP